MRHKPARYRNGYHYTLTRQQRRNRWLLWVGLLLLTLGGNRFVARCQRADAPTGNGEGVRIAMVLNEAHRLGVE